MDGEPPAVCTVTTPVARVQHDCYECDEPIEPGQRYERVKGLWDGSWATFKTCMGCVELRTEYADGDGCYTYGALRETMREANR